MKLEGLPFVAIDWTGVPTEKHPGERGTASWRTHEKGGVRVRMVEYSPGYRADHWCSKGHVVFCVQGEFVSEHRDGSTHRIRQGMSYVVGDGDVPHRTSTESGATLFIVD